MRDLVGISEGAVKASKTQRKKDTIMKIKSNVKASGIQINHNQSGIAVKSTVKAGGVRMNHNQTAR